MLTLGQSAIDGFFFSKHHKCEHSEDDSTLTFRIKLSNIMFFSVRMFSTSFQEHKRIKHVGIVTVL